MRRSRRLFFLLCAAVALSAMVWQGAQMQSPLRRITTTPEEGINTNPTISGDGRFVAFESTEDIAGAGDNDAFRAIRANVSVDPATLFQMGASRAPAPAVSQDGSRIAFASKDNPLGTNNDSNSEIFLHDGARLIQVTNTSPGDISLRLVNGNFQPSISDDGRYIAFSGNRNLAGQNSDGNLEIFVYDTAAANFTQATNSTGIVGFTDAKISGDGTTLAYIRDTGTTPGGNRDLMRQNHQTLFTIGLAATQVQGLALTYGRAISDDGLRVVWSAQTATNTTQVFLFDGRHDNTTRQITLLGPRSTDVPLHPTISGDGSRIAFATRRPVPDMGSNSDSGTEVYTYDIPSGTLARVTNLTTSGATADVVPSLNDDGSVIAFNFSRLLSGAVANQNYESNSEIYVTETAPRPANGSLTILNRASMGHEPSTTNAVAPDSIAAALGGALAFQTVQSQRQTDGNFPTTVAGTTVTVNGEPAQIFFVSPTEVHFHVPATTVLGSADVVITNADGFQSRGSVSTLPAAPGVFTPTGDGLGTGTIIEADTLRPGPFDPSNGNLRLIVFSTGVRQGTTVSVIAGSRTLTLESIVHTENMPGMDEIHVLVPADLRGVGKVALVVRADGRDSNPVNVEFVGDAGRNVSINEFLADPPGSLPTELNGDANHDGVRSASEDEFIEFVNSTTNDIGLGGYRIFTRGTGSDTLRFTFPAGTILPPCGAVVVFGGGNPNPTNPAFGGAQVFAAQSGSLSLANSSGSITLQDQAGTIVTLLAYGGTSSTEADNDQSVTRSPDITGNFAQHLAASGSTRAFSPGTRINSAPFSSCATAISRVDVSPLSATINSGAQQQFTARAFDASNNEVTGVVFSWQSNNATVATIDSNGLASGQAAGSAEIRASGRGVQSAPATLNVNPVAPPNILINEVDSDQAGTDTGEFVELYDGGTGNTSLTGTVVVFYNGSDDKSYAAFDLDGFSTNASGYFTLGNAAVPGVDLTFGNGTLQNGPDAVAIYVGSDLNFPNGTSVTTINLIDAIVYANSAGDDPELLVLLNSGQPQVNENTGSNGAIKSSQRCPNDSGGARNTSTYNQFTPTPDGANVCVAVAPTLSMNDVSQNEGQTGTSTFTFTASLSSPAPAGGVTFDIATADNTATVVDNDYVSKNLAAQTIAAGSQTYQFTVTVNGDGTVEPHEDFFVNVTNVVGATVSDGQGVGTLQNDDSPTLSINDVSAREGNSGYTSFTFTVTSSLPAPAGGITFDIATADGTAQDDDPTSDDNDYLARSLTSQTITAGNTTYTFDVRVNGDTAVEASETFLVNLANASGASLNEGTGQGTIQNDDAALLVISQVYGGGGNAGAQYTNDFVEIFNHGTTTIRFATTPFSVQYAGATASFGSSNKVDLTTGSIAPGQYFLVQLGGGANGVALPTADATGTIAMAATTGKVALVSGTTALSGSGCPLGGTVTDFIGYGTTADCFAGAGRAPAPSNTTADLRKNGGCTDTNENAADFLFSAPFPRNTSSPLNSCVAGAPPNLTINDVTIAEGNTGTTAATFTVSLSAPASSADITFDIATQENTATTANSDYVTRTLTNQVIPAGQTTYSFTVNIDGDEVIENDETFFVNVTNSSGATITDGQGVGTIQNDDVPTLSISDVSLNEGNGGPTTFSFTVSLSAPAPTGGVTFDIATADGTAQDGDPGGEDNDYVAKSLTSQTVPPGSSTYNFDVTVNGDVAIEPSETFAVNVSNVVGATVSDGVGQGTIQNDDSPVLSISDVSQSEGNAGTTTFTFTVTSTLPAPAGGITFDIATADGTAQDDTPPSEDNDYVARSLTNQTITAGNTTYTFEVTVNGDRAVEPDETFAVNLSNVFGAGVSDGSGTGTIQNNDAALLVVSQIYGGGNNAGATFQNDFVELFNRGTNTVNFAVTPYSVQYASAAGTFSAGNATNLTTGSLVPGQYLLIALAGGTSNGAALPPADATNSAVNLSATDGKVALVAGTTVLGGSGCPIGATVADFVGYGSANCAETTASAVLSATKSARRTSSCVDSNNNSADFTVVTNPAAPRNSTTTLNDCNATPSLSIDSVSVTEGHSGTVVATFTVSLSSPAPAGGVTFDIATQNNSATLADNDYVGHTLPAQTITSGNLTFSFAVTVNGDTNVEPDETFFVNVSNVSGATVTAGQGVGTIQNDDSAALPNLSINDVSAAEGNAGPTTFAFTVSLSAPAPAGGVTFNIATADGTAQDDNPATEDNDYVAQSLTSQTIAAGNTSYTFNVTVNGDAVNESNETFFVDVTSVTNAAITDGQGRGTITNDEAAGSPGAIVISQLYGGGGNATAPFLNDFIELFNRGGTAVDVTGWSMQYSAATGTGAFSVTPICPTGPCLIQPGQYFLVKEASGGAIGVGFSADVNGTINLSATAGKVALVNNTTALVGNTVCGTLVSGSVDFVGYGATATCFEGAGPAPAPSNSTSVFRAAGGCSDSNVNSADFATGSPNPRNSGSPTSQCPGTRPDSISTTTSSLPDVWRVASLTLDPMMFNQRGFTNK